MTGSRVPGVSGLAASQAPGGTLTGGSRPAAELRKSLAGWSELIEDHERLRRVRVLVEDRIPERVSLTDAAGAAALHPVSLARLFKKQVGVSFQHWQSAKRVARATRLIGQSNRTLVGVALAAGFGSLDSMEDSFKRFLGRTPRDYRAFLRRTPRDRRS